MLNQRSLQKLQLSSKPWGQRTWGTIFLHPNYEWFPGVDVTLEGESNIPDEPVTLAMNHTDRFNYWPLQYRLWKRFFRFTATWVKGKYYQNGMVAKLLEWTNNIPTVSKGYLISRDFKKLEGRRPKNEEYRALRDLVDAEAEGRLGRQEQALITEDGIDRELFEEPRQILDYSFQPEEETYAEAIVSLYRSMMGRFVELNEEARDLELDLLVFPEGTRSKRLQEGKIGLATMAVYLDAPIVPVGCNGTDKIYPGSSPVAGAGDVVYRFGEPIDRAGLAQYRPDESFVPFVDPPSDLEPFEALTEVLMERINGLLDPEYQHEESEGGSEKKKAAAFV